MNVEQFRGSLLGLAVGDALGTTLEFKLPGSFDFHSEILEVDPLVLPPASGLTTRQWRCVWQPVLWNAGDSMPPIKWNDICAGTGRAI